MKGGSNFKEYKCKWKYHRLIQMMVCALATNLSFYLSSIVASGNLDTTISIISRYARTAASFAESYFLVRAQA